MIPHFSWSRSRCAWWRTGSISLLLFGVLTLGMMVSRAGAQDTDSGSTPTEASDSRRRQLVQLAPHVLWFTPQVKFATLELRNPSDSSRQAQVQVQFAYQDNPHGFPADTIVIDPRSDEQGNVIAPHDTVLLTPGPKEHFAGRWLSGVPASVTLAPHQTKRVTVRLTPPANLPAGEYWARIVTLVRPAERYPAGHDVRQHYALPTKAHVLPLQDTCAVIYRKGSLAMGLAIGPNAVARIDSTNIGGGVNMSRFSRALWVRLPLKLTGNVPFRGMMHSEYRNLETGEIVNPNRLEHVQYEDAVIHFVVETDVLSPGSWEYAVWFDNEDPDIPPAQRLPMTPVRHSFRFTVLQPWQY